MTDRIPLDDLTSDALDHLYDRLDAARRTVDRVDTQAQQHKQRAEQAEAAIDRVRAELALCDWPHAEVRADRIREALDPA